MCHGVEERFAAESPSRTQVERGLGREREKWNRRIRSFWKNGRNTTGCLRPRIIFMSVQHPERICQRLLSGFCTVSVILIQPGLRVHCAKSGIINSAVKKLEKMDFVELKMESGTGNRKVIVLTESGHRYCEEEIMPLIQAELDALAAFSEEERELLLSLMRRQLEALEERVKGAWK